MGLVSPVFLLSAGVLVCYSAYVAGPDAKYGSYDYSADH